MKKKSKLGVKRETIRTLGQELAQVIGGSIVMASQYVTQCARLCTTNPWTQNCGQTQ